MTLAPPLPDGSVFLLTISSRARFLGIGETQSATTPFAFRPRSAQLQRCPCRPNAFPPLVPCARVPASPPPASIRPEALEAVCRQLRVSDGVLDVAVAEIMLHPAGILTIVREFEAAGMPEHVRVNRE